MIFKKMRSVIRGINKPHFTEPAYWSWIGAGPAPPHLIRGALKTFKTTIENRFNISVCYKNKTGPFFSFLNDNDIKTERNKRLAKALHAFFDELGLERDQAHIARDISDFNSLMDKWTYKNLAGGLGYNDGLFLFAFIRAAKPTFCIESGVWRGFSTYLMDAATSPDCKINAYDINLGSVIYRSPKATYFENDITATPLDIDADTSLAFFDDHVSHYERLLLADALKIRFLVFDDDVTILNVHSDRSPPLPTISMLFDKGGLPESLCWTVNGRTAVADFSSITNNIDTRQYIKATAPDLFEITGYRNSSRTSYLIRRPAKPSGPLPPQYPTIFNTAD
jgi:hypothetical protein